MKRMLLAALALGLSLAAPAFARADTLTVGVYPDNPPWEAKQVDGSFQGFEVDLVNAIAKKLGDKVDFKDLGFQALFAATSSHRIDMAISTITITKERLKNQAFTQGYYDSDLALVASKNTKMTDLKDIKGKTIGVISASTGDAWLKEHGKEYGVADVKGYDTQQNLLLDTQSGRVDGAIGSITSFIFAFKKMPTMKVVVRMQSGERFGIMMPKDSKLLEKVNDAISALKKEGYIAKLHEKWLGEPAPKDSSTVQVRPIPH